MPTYKVNPKTRTIHILGNCQHTQGHLADSWPGFHTEEAANTAYAGNLKHCHLCWRRRDEEGKG